MLPMLSRGTAGIANRQSIVRIQFASLVTEYMIHNTLCDPLIPLPLNINVRFCYLAYITDLENRCDALTWKCQVLVLMNPRIRTRAGDADLFLLSLQLYSSAEFGRRWQLIQESVVPNRFYW